MVSSLKNLCKVPGLVEILNHPHIKKEIFSLPINKNNYKERDDALQSVLSEFLKDYNPVVKSNIPRQFVFLIGFEMWKWANYVLKYFDLPFIFSESFIQSSLFTSNGLIDEDKAARELLKEQSFSIFLKYNIACQYFLEEIIPGLWEVLQKERDFKKWLEEHDPESPMVMWSNYLNNINSTTSVRNRRIKTLNFMKRVFLYGLKENNVAAIKYSYGSKEGSRNTKTDVTILRKNVYTYYCHYVRQTFKRFQSYSLESHSLLCPDFLSERNIVMYVLSLMNKRGMKEFFQHFRDSYYFVCWLLLWPFQNQFMDFAHIVFENFGVTEYNEIVYHIISFQIDQYTCQSYDYCQLLRDFLIKTPANLKEQIIRSQTEASYDVEDGLIYMIFMMPNFTGDDMANINLILQNANLTDRKNILLHQGGEICEKLVIDQSNFRLANLFLKSLNLDEEALHTFKNDFVFDGFSVIMEKQSIKFCEEFLQWVVGSDEIDGFKSEIFHRWTHSDDVEYFFLELEEEIPFSFLNQLLKWFQKTDADIEEWKQNIIYSPLMSYNNPYWFDQLLKFCDYSHERVRDIKREILLGRLSEIARTSLDLQNVRLFLNINIFILCSCKKGKFIEFTEQLRSFYEDSIKNKICLLCLSNNFVHVNGEQLNCEHHGTNGFVTLEKVNKICSNFISSRLHS